LKKAALLFLALAVWPVLDSFYYGQPSTLSVALVAASWWLCSKDRPIAAGVALAFATALKPHTVILVPVALAASGRFKPVVSWAAVCTLLVGAFALALGPAGIGNWWQALVYGQTDTGQAMFTAAFVFGAGPIAYAVEALQGAAAIVIARRWRSDLNLVFALGLIGSLVFAFHLHDYDYIELILAAWLVLRTAPPLWHRLWLLAGTVTLQAIALGMPLPQLIWDAGWLVILGLGSAAASDEPAPAAPLKGGVGG
jgi:hypothetical protein